MHPTRPAVLAGKARPGLPELVESGRAEAGPLRGLSDVMVSPHMAGDFYGWSETLRDVFIENFGRFRDGRPLRNVVDKRLGYVGSAPLVGTSREGGIG